MKWISGKGLGLCTIICFLLTAQLASATTVRGTMLLEDGGTMAHGTVAFFDAEIGPPPNLDKYFRMPEIVDFLDDQSTFRVKVPAGKYYIGARKDITHFQEALAPINGDVLLIVHDDKGVPRVFTVTEGKTLDLGEVRQGYVYLDSTPDYVSSTDKKSQQVTALDGAIFANIVNHLQGITVMAEKLLNTVGSGPVFFSRPSRQDGKYFLRLPGEGTYLLRLYGGGTKFIGRFDRSPEAQGQKVQDDYVIVKLAKDEIKEQLLYTVDP